MLLVFVVLSQLVIFADTFPSVVDAFVQTTPLGQFATSGFGLTLLTIFCGLLATWVLLEMMFIIVPNQHISFRDSWFGALLAAVAVQAYLQLFPFYCIASPKIFPGGFSTHSVFLLPRFSMSAETPPGTKNAKQLVPAREKPKMARLGK
jgi:uncharacterized BrkB/YihY/UPF0761 family membrane protein